MNNLTVSLMNKESVARILSELQESAWSDSERLRLDNVKSMLEAGITVHLLEWDGEATCADVLPGVYIGSQQVAVVEGSDVWAVGAYVFATVSKLLSFGSKPSHKYLLY